MQPHGQSFSIGTSRSDKRHERIKKELVYQSQSIAKESTLLYGLLLVCAACKFKRWAWDQEKERKSYASGRHP
eukprot:scaffold93759_cov17-Tisochrysis_lutea.AAC.1